MAGTILSGLHYVADFKKTIEDFLINVEETGRIKNDPYFDSKGLVTIGIGFNIESNGNYLGYVLEELGLNNANSDIDSSKSAYQIFQTIITSSPNGDENKLRNDLNAALTTHFSSIVGSNATFELTNDQAKNVLHKILADKKPRLDKLLNDNGIDVASLQNTKEYAALTSLFYNNESTLIGPNLLSALRNNNRAEAWFEIRYGSNKSNEKGVAKRRYFEADTFSLYNGTGNVTTEEAKSIFRMYTRHKDKIEQYERTYSSQIQKANSDYGTSIVKSKDASLASAKNHLIANFADGKPIDNVMVGADTGNYTGDNPNDFIKSKDNDTKNDLIFGEGGDDLLRGIGDNDVIYGGEGSDTIYGGTGNDILKGENGNDRYVFNANEGQDTIIDSDGNGAVIVSGRQLIGGKGKDGTYTDKAGNTYQWDGNAGSSLLINGSITVENFSNGKLGINLTPEDSEPLPEPIASTPYALPNDLNWLLQGLYEVINALVGSFNSAEAAVPPCPVVLDLDGDGVETTPLSDSTHFDHDGNGFAEQTGWISGDDWILVMDRDGNGIIDGGKELFGNETVLNDGTKATNGFDALTELDDNLDGKIDINDSSWNQLLIWKDTDGNGYESGDELHTLDELGIQSLNTGYTDSTAVDAQGNEHRQIGSFTKVDGTTGTASDVWFQTDKTFTIANEWLDVPTDIAALPDLQGYGNVYDLQQAMARDRQAANGEGLKGLIEQFMTTTDTATRNSLMEQILYKWTGSDTIDGEAGNEMMRRAA